MFRLGYFDDKKLLNIIKEFITGAMAGVGEDNAGGHIAYFTWRTGGDVEENIDDEETAKSSLILEKNNNNNDVSFLIQINDLDEPKYEEEENEQEEDINEEGEEDVDKERQEDKEGEEDIDDEDEENENRRRAFEQMRDKLLEEESEVFYQCKTRSDYSLENYKGKFNII
ncbi:hypothetical protein P5V15_002585 [Pogonomyrmex californicus]